MRGVFISALVAGGCSFTHGALPDGNQGTGDARSSDGAGDARACSSWPQAPTGLDPCVAPAPTVDINLCTGTDHRMSTNDGTLVGANDPASVLDESTTPPRRIISINELVICAGTTLTITGAPSAVFVVHGRARIEGTIDVSAWFGPLLQVWFSGPGAGDCAVGNGATPPVNTEGAGGGGGGGHGSAGGAGGPGTANTAAAGGIMNGSASLLPLRGGCRGGLGGLGDSGLIGGIFGPGGGAIQIAVRGGLSVTGRVRASGAPGSGGQCSDCGGGGGGAGGGILLEAEAITVTGANAALCANGGGGGGGANDGGPLNVGGDGALGTCALSAAAAGMGGSGGGQPGGKGAFGTVAAENGGSGNEGGGGGGGAVGRIRLRSAMPATIDSASTITPPFL